MEKDPFFGGGGFELNAPESQTYTTTQPKQTAQLSWDGDSDIYLKVMLLLLILGSIACFLAFFQYTEDFNNI